MERLSPWSRRSFLFSVTAARLAAQASRLPTFPGEIRRYQDPTTELDVYRLTDPDRAAILPAYYNRALARNSTSLLFAGNRGGTLQAFRMDLKTGETRQLTEAGDLDAASLTLTPDSRSCVYSPVDPLRRRTFPARGPASCTACPKVGSAPPA